MYMRYVEVTTPKLLASHAIVRRLVGTLFRPLGHPRTVYSSDYSQNWHEHFLLAVASSAFQPGKIWPEVQSFPSCLDDDAGPGFRHRPASGCRDRLPAAFICADFMSVSPSAAHGLDLNLSIYIQQHLYLNKGPEIAGGPVSTGRATRKLPERA